MTFQEYARLSEGKPDPTVPGLVGAHGMSDSLEHRFAFFAEAMAPFRDRVYAGKVRDRIDIDANRSLLISSDRISAFDRVLGLVPSKGELLNRISLWWFKQTTDIVPNHILEAVTSRAIHVKRLKILPLEIIVRAYLTGSAWRDYRDGKSISGIALPKGMRRDQAFATPIITPSTKEEVGLHDQPISREEILSRGLLGGDLLERVYDVALGLFRRGTEIARSRGLLLVDTKYEFGLDSEGNLVLGDEIHTPDSSRFWYADDYEERLARGDEPRKLDKEYLRAWLLEHGWKGDGPAPVIPHEVFVELGWRYVQAFQELTGEEFRPLSSSVEAEAQILRTFLYANR